MDKRALSANLFPLFAISMSQVTSLYKSDSTVRCLFCRACFRAPSILSILSDIKFPFKFNFELHCGWIDVEFDMVVFFEVRFKLSPSDLSLWPLSDVSHARIQV